MRRLGLYIWLIALVLVVITASAFAFPRQANQLISWQNSVLAPLGFSLPSIPETDFKLGLDLQGGAHLVYEADLSQVVGLGHEEAMNGLRDVIERRVNLFGVKEPVVQVVRAADSYRLVVELAGVINSDQAIELIGQTPFLDFRTERSIEERDKILAKQDELRKAQEEGRSLDQVENWTEALQDPYFVASELTGRFLKTAQLAFGGPTGQEPIVVLEFNDEGAKLFMQLTKDNVGKSLAMYVDNQLISAPVVQEEITGGKAEVSGNFTVESAQALARNLSAGALPVPISLISQEQVGATLGKVSLEKSLEAGLLGFLAIVVFMIVFYRLPGLLAALALLCYVILAAATFKLIGVTLTLAGIGGFILSIGMAIDANVLILSRFREELEHRGNTGHSLEPAFARAWPAIRDGNITTLAVAVVLFAFGDGFVKGFALTLGAGLVVSVLVAILVSRLLMTWLIGTKLTKVLVLWR